VYAPTRTADGVRLRSHRPSVLAKVEALAGGSDVLTGPGWEERLKALLAELTAPERALVLATRVGEEDALPLPAETVLHRVRTDWFPDFLSHGAMRPHFQPIVSLADGRVVGREALMRGKLGATEVRGAELLDAAEAHDAVFSFDARARAAALDIGMPLLPEGEVLFVNLDPRAVLDVEGSLRTTWPLVERLGADPGRICVELVAPERAPDPGLLRELVAAHRARGALVALDDLTGSGAGLAILELVRPDLAKLDVTLTAGIERSPGRRALVAALVACAHEQRCRVIAEGVERVAEFEAVRDLGVDLGQGFYFGHPTERPMAVDPRLVTRRV